MKLNIALLKPPTFVKYFEEIEFQEINFFSEYFILKNAKRRKKIAHYWLIDELHNLSEEAEFYDFCPGILTKNTPIITHENFKNLARIAGENNVPMYTIYDKNCKCPYFPNR
jgi:hypothetical protein